MGTYYTDQLQASGFDLSKWLKEEVVRAMGLAFLFREDGPKSEAEIRTSIKGSSSGGFYRDELAKAKKFKAALESGDTKFLKERYNEELSWAIKYIKREREKRRKGKPGFEKATREIARLRKRADELGYSDRHVIVGLLDYAARQLQMVNDSDFGPIYRPSVCDHTFSEWKAKLRVDVEDEIARYEKEIAEEKKRAAECTQAYDELVAFVNREVKA